MNTHCERFTSLNRLPGTRPFADETGCSAEPIPGREEFAARVEEFQCRRCLCQIQVVVAVNVGWFDAADRNKCRITTPASRSGFALTYEAFDVPVESTPVGMNLEAEIVFRTRLLCGLELFFRHGDTSVLQDGGKFVDGWGDFRSISNASRH